MEPTEPCLQTASSPRAALAWALPSWSPRPHADCAWQLLAQMPTAGMCFMLPRLCLACLGTDSRWASQVRRWVAAAGEKMEVPLTRESWSSFWELSHFPDALFVRLTAQSFHLE